MFNVTIKKSTLTLNYLEIFIENTKSHCLYSIIICCVFGYVKKVTIMIKDYYSLRKFENTNQCHKFSIVYVGCAFKVTFKIIDFVIKVTLFK